MTLEEFKSMKEGEYYYFKGMKFYHIGWDIDGVEGMPMCTKEQYENFELSFAHIYDNGISRFGVKIGTIKDLKKRKPCNK